MAQPILLLNCGSSSIKYQLLDPAEPGPRAVGIVQRIGLETSTIDHEVGDNEYHEETHFANHVEAVAAVVQMFRDQAYIGADLSGETGWGLLNCVTEYVDFKKRARNQSNRLNAAWFGEGAGIKARAIGELERLAA